jgi:aryl-alcohol dehydrogenase-like predicted oxidoreductase
MLHRSIESDVLPTARELGVGLAVFGTLSMGVLGGSRSVMNSDKLSIVETLENFAKEKGITLSQLAIAWALAQGDDIITVVGSRRPEQLLENISAVDVTLTAKDLEKIGKVLPDAGAGRSLTPQMKFDENGYIHW